MRLLFVAVATSALLALVPAAGATGDPWAPLLAPAGACGASDQQLDLDRPDAVSVMACLTNYARTHSGLRPLKLNPVLTQAGIAKLSADVECRAFSHSPCGKPFESVFASYLHGASTYRIGENIAWGTGPYGTPREVMREWLHSAGHRENILTPDYTELGIGYLANQDFQGYSTASLWSQQFGTRSPRTLSAAPRVRKPSTQRSG